MIQFYAPDINVTPVLPESDSKHAVRVLRMIEGDPLEMVDGKGYRYRCKLIEAHPKRAMVEILERVAEPLIWPNRITLAVAPTKLMDRMEWLVEKATEIGVNDIVPVLCQRSERRELKLDRLEKIVVSAMKQSLKSTLPIIYPLTPLPRFLNSVTAPQRYVGYCSDEVERRLLAKTYVPRQDVALLIGPEGDFTPQEVEMCLASGFTPVTMGDNRLRTETAALVAIDTCHIINQFTQE
ncbi:MAG: 16S rRNA (uracil(1498)-N(3))-methyltransferase [Bacteroidales bacterium]|nr:16S rRNA (uracil(1498)-N(3))-methyltransferase [Bacteroidales bacterium]